MGWHNDSYVKAKVLLATQGKGALAADPARRGSTRFPWRTFLEVAVLLAVVASAASIFEAQRSNTKKVQLKLLDCQKSAVKQAQLLGSSRGPGSIGSSSFSSSSSSSSSATAPAIENAAATSGDLGPPAAAAAAAAASAAAKPSAVLYNSTNTYAAFCLIVRGDHHRIREWVAYHWSAGVGRFYVYDDNSSPPLEGTLADFIKIGVVSYRHLKEPLGKPHQVAVYDDCIKQHRDKHSWLGFLDSDEFLVIRDGSPDLPTVLKRYESYGGLVVSWRWFGSSGHVERPRGLALESFTACAPSLHDHVKTLVTTAHVAGASGNPHAFLYKPGYFAVNTNLTQMGAHAYANVSDPASHPEGDVLLINHYVVRSLQEFKFKISRGSAMQFGKTMPFWEHVESQMTDRCTYAVPLADKVRAQFQLLASASGIPLPQEEA